MLCNSFGWAISAACKSLPDHTCPCRAGALSELLQFIPAECMAANQCFQAPTSSCCCLSNSLAAWLHCCSRTGRSQRLALPATHRKLSRQRSEYEHSGLPPSPTLHNGVRRSDSAEVLGRHGSGGQAMYILLAVSAVRHETGLGAVHGACAAHGMAPHICQGESSRPQQATAHGMPLCSPACNASWQLQALPPEPVRCWHTAYRPDEDIDMHRGDTGREPKTPAPWHSTVCKRGCHEVWQPRPATLRQRAAAQRQRQPHANRQQLAAR